MDIEFHYYITYIIALKAGFEAEDASVIAHASQYTDDNTMVYTINEGKPGEYSNYISQAPNILKPQRQLMRIYPVFHFMPGRLDEIAGDSARRRDGKLHLMNTIPDSAHSRRLLKAAFDSRDPYRIGVATHMYADAFAHQNFVGFGDSFNDMEGLVENMIPGVGHADVRDQPDLPVLTWNDERLVESHSKIDNRRRFLYAAQCIYEKFCNYLHTPQDSRSRDLMTQIDEAIGKYDGSAGDRIDRYKDLIGRDFVDYDKKDWFEEAVGFVNEEIPYAGGGDTVPKSETEWVWKGSYKESRWYRFQEAVKAHQRPAMDTVIGPIFEKMEFREVYPG